MLPSPERIRPRVTELEEQLGAPEALADPVRYRQLARDHARLSGLLRDLELIEEVSRRLVESRALLDDAESDPEFRDLVETEIRDLEQRQSDLERSAHRGLVPPDPNDDRNTIVEIRAGTGGDEAALFAGDLFRMYQRYADRQGWRVEPLSSSPTELGGFKEIIFSVQGDGVYRSLRYESGVHRVQRIPVTEAGGRIHTSTATVAVLPEAETVEIQIPEKELRIDVFRSSGPGGQSVNTTDSAVRVMHVPTGLIVQCQDEKSQLRNKEKALRVLRARLLERHQEEEQAKTAANRRSQIGSGDRSERIRTYNFPQNRVTDHRIGLTLHALPAVLEGDLDPLVEKLADVDYRERLAAATSSAA